ncbi:MAG: LptF/LptG family permease, partial [Elusimicrobia bacterium]|nr:LptF/LptG family permease [Elusimicrobiota bacterium]
SVLPVCYFRAQKLWQEKIAAEWQFDRYQNVMLMGGAGRFVTVKMFEVRAGRMIRPVLDYYSPGGIVRQIDARGADWDPGASRWIFQGGVERHFEPGGRIAEKPFERFASDLEVPPRKLVPRARNPDEMSIREMVRYMREVQLLGGSLRETRAALHAKMAYPFANIILCAIGIPIALRLRRGHRALGFALALGISFLYLWVTELGRILGAGERVPPIVGAWIAPVVFGFWALRLFRRSGA